jgi:hypothetical protein
LTIAPGNQETRFGSLSFQAARGLFQQSDILFEKCTFLQLDMIKILKSTSQRFLSGNTADFLKSFG